MAKYDQYKVTTTPDGSFIAYNRELSVLFEDGDDVMVTMQQADMLLGDEASGDAVPLKEQLLALPRSDFRALIVEVWIEQMSALGNERYSYANQLREDVNTAQNA